MGLDATPEAHGPRDMAAASTELGFEDRQAAESALWGLWRGNADEAARHQLLTLHLPYARVVAASYYAKRIHNEIEFADYHQLASLGLIDAMERFDPGVGVQFRTFAARRMHGTILDGLEQSTEKQQQIAAKQRLLAQRRADIKQAAAEETNAQPGKPGARGADQMLRYVAEAGLAFALAWILDGTGMVDSGEQGHTVPFYRNAEMKQLRERVAGLVNSLSEQEKSVIQRHYFQEVPFEEIAQQMKLSRGRISQIHRKALERIKESLRGQNGCDVAW
ncbi:MAG: polymerase, sigma 28 subunit, FliA/WhiG subfamily [Ramlibacter sp.]|nr:polymerase, sigma 28 subunit, FliA/WhiG subfamily [Ramlibacter sp.]